MRSRFGYLFGALLTVGLLLTLSENASAQIYKSGAGCYEIRLAGSLIDVNECKQTAIRLRQVDCSTKANVKLDRVMANLTQCSPEQARGTVATPTGAINFLARRNLQSGMEYWSISSATAEGEALPVAQNRAATVRRPKTNKPTAVKRETWATNLRGPERGGISLYADFGRVFFSQDKFKRTGAVSNNLLLSSRNLRSSDLLRDSFSLGFLNARAVVGEGAFDFILDISTGALAEVYLATPMGNTPGGSLFVTQAFGSYVINPNFKMKAGIFDSPLNIEDKRSGVNSLYSSSLSQTYAIPHVFTGIGAQFNFASVAFEADVVNGWNKFTDDNSDLAFAFSAKKNWSSLSTDAGLFFSPNEGGSFRGQIVSGLLNARYLLNDKMNFGLAMTVGILTPGDLTLSSTQWYSLLGSGTYKLSPRDEASISLEMFETSGAAFFQRSGWASSFVANAGWKRRYGNSFASHVELQADMPMGTDGTGPNAEMDFKILTAVSWSGNWGDQPTPINVQPNLVAPPPVPVVESVTPPAAAPSVAPPAAGEIPADTPAAESAPAEAP